MKKKQVHYLYAVAVDLGATNLRVALVRNDGKILKKLVISTPKNGRSGSVVTKKVITQIKKLLTITKKDFANIAGIGVSVAGPVDCNRGMFYPPNLPFRSVSIATPLRKAFGCPVEMLNDTNAAVIASQKFGEGKGKNNISYITISSGIGVGAIVNGKRLSGELGNAGELGHAVVEAPFADGIHDWEYYASGKNVMRFFRQWLVSVDEKKPLSIKDGKTLFTAAKRKNAIALRFIDALGNINAQGMANIILAYNPAVIILGGGVIFGDGALIIGPLKKHLKKHITGTLPIIVVTTLGDSISLLGAAAAMFEKTTE